jgi:hypothetical protein
LRRNSISQVNLQQISSIAHPDLVRLPGENSKNPVFIAAKKGFTSIFFIELQNIKCLADLVQRLGYKFKQLSLFMYEAGFNTRIEIESQ